MITRRQLCGSIFGSVVTSHLATFPTVAAQLDILELHGELDRSNFPVFEQFISKNLNRVIGLQISVEQSKDRAQFHASASNGMFVTYLESSSVYEMKSEIVAKSGYSFQHGAFVFDGFFIVKSGGMHQGIISYGLMQTDEATVRLNKSIKIRRVALKR